MAAWASGRSSSPGTLGVSVVGVASASKKTFVESLGAVHVESGFGLAERVDAAVPGGIDAIYDLVGSSTLEAVAALLADRSKLITAADRETVARLGGAPVARARTRAVLDKVAALVVAGVLDPHVTARFPLDGRPRRCGSWRMGTPRARS